MQNAIFLNIHAWKSLECCLASQPPSLWSGKKQTHLWAANLDNSWPEWELTAGSSFGIVNADVAKFLRHYSMFYASRDDSASWLHDADWWFDIKWWKIDCLTSSLVKIMLVICWNPETFRQVKSTESQRYDRKEKSILPKHAAGIEKVFGFTFSFPVFQRWRKIKVNVF